MKFRTFLFLFFNSIYILNAQDLIQPEAVQIVRDSWGVAHVYAPTDAEVIYGFAWAQAEDNFELMQHSYAATRGRASEILGKEGAIFDLLRFVLQPDSLLANSYDTAFSDDFKKIIRAYVQGANDYARLHPEEVLLKDFFPLTEKDVVIGYLLGNIIMTGTVFDVAKIFTNQMQFFEPYSLSPSGSNGYAFSKNRMQNKRTTFVCNSHQPLEGVLSWYEIHVHSEEGYNMLGGTFSLGITPLIGSNEQLAWTHTVNSPDLTDIYQLHMHPKKKHYYRMDGQWLKLVPKKLKLKVKIAGIKIPVHIKLFQSKHGIVMKNKSGYYALRFSANQRIAAAEQWYRMGKARNFEQFKAALAMQQIPCFNVLYADKNDTIYNLANGLIPKGRNEHYEWDAILPGDTSALLWSDSFYRLSELPQITNPASGYIFNSNNSPFTATDPPHNIQAADYPNHLMGYLQKETNRSIRMLEIMRNLHGEKLSYEEFKDIKYDIRFADSTFYTFTIENMDDLPRLSPQKYPDLAEILDLLNTWDRSPDLKEDKVAVFSVAFTYIIDELTKRTTLLESNILPEEVFVKALRKAKRYVMRHYGTLRVPFGEMHIHRREKGSKVVYPFSGMPENIAAMAYVRDKKQKGKLRTYSGESYILIVQFDENGIARLETINAFGASNKPDSPHYTDQMRLFANRQLKTMTLDKATIFNNAARIYRPGN